MRDGRENSERVTGQRSENQHAWDGKREKTREGRGERVHGIFQKRGEQGKSQRPE